MTCATCNLRPALANNTHCLGCWRQWYVDRLFLARIKASPGWKRRSA